MDIAIIKTDCPEGSAAVCVLMEMLRKGSLTAGVEAMDVGTTVREIIDYVEALGDVGAAEITSRLDNADITPDTIGVPEEQIREAHRNADGEFLQLVRRVSDNIRQYQQSILIADPAPLKRGGRTLGVRYTPMDRVGVYVPGGKAIYPSTVLMTVVPAQVAGVEQIAITSPPTGGEIDPMVLALAGELGISEVYRLGGAVAIAAMAVGTETIAPVNKIVGPGNAFVAEAKRQLFGRVGIDSIAGPSEVLIVADQTARADCVAADMLAQVEHDPGSAILVTPSAELADAVAAELDAQLPALARSDAAGACLEAYGAIIVTADLDEACRIADDFATEHLQIVTADDRGTLDKISNAGAVFLGPHTPVPLGDYYAGPSHVLPTGGTAKFSGPLSCNDFLTAASILSYDAESLDSDAADVIDFATREGLTAHANAVRIRTQQSPTDDK
ncbi:MAG: histidinol dehydrogenase [Phycisphaerae bacterium]|nr:histidinol dehydrogenase [Phycisphaerae bacterium]